MTRKWFSLRFSQTKLEKNLNNDKILCKGLGRRLITNRIILTRQDLLQLTNSFKLFRVASQHEGIKQKIINTDARLFNKLIRTRINEHRT